MRTRPGKSLEIPGRPFESVCSDIANKAPVPPETQAVFSANPGTCSISGDFPRYSGDSGKLKNRGKWRNFANRFETRLQNGRNFLADSGRFQAYRVNPSGVMFRNRQQTDGQKHRLPWMCLPETAGRAQARVTMSKFSFSATTPDFWVILTFLVDRVCRDGYPNAGESDPVFALSNALRYLGLHCELHKGTAHPSWSVEEAAKRLDAAMRATHAKRIHLVPLDLAADLPSVAFGSAKVNRLTADELRTLVDETRLKRFYPRQDFDAERFSEFHRLIVEQTVALDQMQEARPSSRQSPGASAKGCQKSAWALWGRPPE